MPPKIWTNYICFGTRCAGGFSNYNALQKFDTHLREWISESGRIREGGRFFFVLKLFGKEFAGSNLSNYFIMPNNSDSALPYNITSY